MSNVYRLEDIVSYCQCPLKVRYISLGLEEEKIDSRSIVVRAMEAGISTFMREASKPLSSWDRSSTIAIETYKAVLTYYDQKKLLSYHNFLNLFNSGIVLLNKFACYIRERYDRAVCGALNDLSCIVGDYNIISNVSGIVSFNDKEASEREYGVIYIAPRPIFTPTWDKIREGYCYKAIKQIMEGMSYASLCIVQIDPFRREIFKYSIKASDLTVFESLSLAAIQGIKNSCYLPQPSKDNCGKCYFEKICEVKYCNPNLSKALKKIIKDKKDELS